MVDTVRSFYLEIAAGNLDAATSLMSADVEWVTVEEWPKSDDNDDLELLSAFMAQTLANRYGRSWAFKMNGRGPEQVAQHVLHPFIEEGSSFAPSPKEFRTENDRVVWLGSLTKIDRASGEHTDSAFAHVWTVKEDQLAGLRQFIYPLVVPSGRPQ